MIRSGKYKLRKNLDTLEMELFDLSRDIGEKDNLAADARPRNPLTANGPAT